MRLFRSSRRSIAFVLVTALLFAQSALALAACWDSGHTAHANVAHHEDAQAEHAHPKHVHGVLCQAVGEEYAQARSYAKTFEIPAPVGHRVYFLLPPLAALSSLTIPVEQPRPYLAVAPPPLSLPLTIVLSRFRN